MKLPALSKQFWVALTTLAIIGAFFAYYLLVYVNGREENIREEKYRALERYGKNMQNIYADYEKSIDRIWNQERGPIAKKFREERNKLSEKYKIGNTKFNDVPWQQIEAAKAGIAAIRQSAGDQKTLYQLDKLETELKASTMLAAYNAEWERRRNELRDNFNIIVNQKVKVDFPKIKYDGYMTSDEYEDTIHRQFDKVFFPLKTSRSDRFGVFSIATEDFAYKPNQFDDFFIIKKYDESEHHHKNNGLALSDETYETFENHVDLQSIDSFMVKEHGLLTHHFRDLRLADTDYKLFVHTIEFNQGENWILCGLVKTKNYKSQARAADPLLIIVALLILLGLLMAMPILKLIIMNTFERLSAANVWLTGFSIVCGSAVLFLIIWAGSHNLQELDKVDDNLKTLSDTVSSRFQNELSAMHQQLTNFNDKQYDSILHYINGKLRKNCCRDNLATNPTANGKTLPATGPLKKNRPANNARAAGNINQKKTAGKRPPKTNLADSCCTDESFLMTCCVDSLSLNATSAEQFFSHGCSYVIGDFLAHTKEILGKQRTPSPYQQFNSVMWVNDSGRMVINISNRKRSPDYRLSTVETRSYFKRALHDSLWYLGGDRSKGFALQSMQSWTDHSPEAGMGISIPERPGVGSVLAMSTKLRSVMSTLFPPGYSFCIIDAKGEVWFHSSVEKNNQENILQEIDHLGKLAATVAGRGSTCLTTDYNGGRCRLFLQPIENLPLFVVTFHEKDFQRTPVVLTLLFAFSLMLIFFLLQGVQLLVLFGCKLESGEHKPNAFFLEILRPSFRYKNATLYKKSIIIQLVLIAFLIVVYFFGDLSWSIVFFTTPVMLMMFNQTLHYVATKSPGHTKESRGRKNRFLAFIGISFVLIVLANRMAFGYLNHKFLIFTIQLLLIAGLIAAATVSGWPAMRLELWKETAKSQRKYYAFILLWWSVVSFLPVAFFYKVAHCEESQLWAKYILLKSTEAVAARSNVQGEISEPLKRQQKPAYHPKDPGNYLSHEDSVINNPDIVDHDAFHKLLFEVWPRMSGPFGISSATAFEEAQDKKWRWNRADSAMAIIYTPQPGGRINYYAELPPYYPFGGHYGFGIFLLIVTGILFVVWLIFFCTKYIFGVDIIPRVSMIDAFFVKEQIRNSSRAFIVGLPLSEKRQFATQTFNTLSQSSIDLQDLNYTFNATAGLYLVKHFEFSINDHAFNKKRLELFQNMLMNPGHKIIILSTVEPAAILEVYRRKICDAQKELADDRSKDDTKLLEFKTALRNWRNVLSEFPVYYKTIRPSKIETNSALEKYVRRELNACTFLQRLLQTQPLRWNTIGEADFIRRVEEIAEPYYNALWNAFSETEKLLLFDLASDGFVNLKSHRTIRSLMQKGVVIRDHSLELMNHSFRNFILSTFRQDEEIEITRQMQKKGTWSSIRTVLVLVLIAIVVFIALAQKDLFSNVNAFVAALTGALTLLTKFGGLFGSGSKAKD